MTEKCRGWTGSHWIRPEKRLALYLRDAFTCAYCARDLRGAAPDELTLDHLVPRCQGGSNEATNLVLACRHCNSARQSRSWTEYARTWSAGARQRRIRALIGQDLAPYLTLAKAITTGAQAGLVADVEAAR